MNRRDLFKRAIAAPLAAAVPVAPVKAPTMQMIGGFLVEVDYAHHANPPFKGGYGSISGQTVKTK